MQMNDTWYLSSKIVSLEQENIDNTLIVSEIFTSKNISSKILARKKRQEDDEECLWGK